jgi:glycosyltransferase involved in cell wall biosynthesis
VGPVEQEELHAYYGNCGGLILPTLLESFSGTYLEAMQFKCPILTSDLDFAHDVCGPAARYFDPFDTSSIRDAILELMKTPARRDELVQAGVERRRTYVRDWDSIVADALAELESLVN